MLPKVLSADDQNSGHMGFRVALLILFVLGPLAAEQVEVALFEGGEGVQFFQRAARLFEQEYPGRTVLIQADPAISDKVRMRVLEGRYPEVTNANMDVWKLIENELLLPLDPWLDGPSNWRDTFLPGSLEPFQYQGKTYGVPLVYVVRSVYYNKALFRKYGWKAPETWDELLELCGEIKEKERVPFAFQGAYPYYARPLVEHTYFHLAGRAAYEAQQLGLEGSFDNPEMRESLALLDTLAKESFQEGFQGMSHTAAQLEFFQGNAVMLFCGSWLYSEMRDNIPPDFELGAFKLPVPNSPRSRSGAEYVTSGGYFFVFRESEHPEAGVEFLQTLTSRSNAARFAAERGYPVAVEGANVGLNPAMSDVARQLDSIDETFGAGAGPGLEGLDQVWNDNLSRLLGGTQTPQETAELMEREVSALRLRALHPDRISVNYPYRSILFLSLMVMGLLFSVSGLAESPLSRRVRVSSGQAVRFIGPALLIFTLFFALPSLLALGASLFRWDGVGPWAFVGLLHFKRLLLESQVFWLALGHNAILMVVPAAVVIPLALLLATLLHQKVVGKRVFRIWFFFPNLVGVAGVLLWQQLLHPQNGPVNRLLVLFGFEEFRGFAWLSPDHLYYALIIMGIWSAAGFNMVLFLAAMQAVPSSLYEVARVNGATVWQQFRFVTLPLIRETVTVAVILLMIGGMKAFEAIWILTNQAPTSDTHVVGTLMIRSLFVEQRIGEAAALATLLFLVVLTGSLITRKVSVR